MDLRILIMIRKRINQIPGRRRAPEYSCRIALGKFGRHSAVFERRKGKSEAYCKESRIRWREGSFRYRAFLSYSHRAKEWGQTQGLHEAIGQGIEYDKEMVGRQTRAGAVPNGTLATDFRDRRIFRTAIRYATQTNQRLYPTILGRAVFAQRPRAAKYGE